MIYLFVFLLGTATPTANDIDGWASGDYSARVYTYQTITACDAARSEVTNKSKATMLVSKCSTGPETPAFYFYSGGKAAPAATPKPPVFDEKPKPPSAPAKPDWEEAA